MAMRGLTVFITDIRNCRSREDEEKRINKELGNIRAKFKEGKMTSYDKKKYVAKLMYTYLLGWEVDFGHVEVSGLISGTKYTEKQIGYLALTLMLSENSDLTRMIVNSMKNDLTSMNEVHNCLALNAIANIGGKEIAEALHGDVQRLLVSGASNPFVKKKAAMCLLRLFRKSPEVLPATDWASKIVSLIDEHDIGVSSSVITLVTSLAQQYPDEYAVCITKVVNKLDNLQRSGCPTEYEYYKLPAPWLQVKCLRLLQCYPPESLSQTPNLKGILQTVVNKSQENTKAGNYANAMNSIVLEGINLAVHLDPESEIVKKSINILGTFITHKETNFRYLGLETMANIASAVESLDLIKRHTDGVLLALRDRDISVRRRALDLLYCMCDSTNSRKIVSELLQYLVTADFAIREELVLKIAILAERFATDYAWYVDVILQLISTAGDHVSEEIWYRVVQIVVNNQDLQQYAASTVFKALNSPSWHETAVKVAGYILGEFGDLIADEPESPPIEQFVALHSKFGACSTSTKALLFTSYVKLVNLFPEIKNEVVHVFQQYSNVLDSEMQQRACEYLALIQSPNPNLLEVVCEEMPPFEEKEESALVSLVQKKEIETTDKALRLRANKKTKHTPLSNLSKIDPQRPGRRDSASSTSSSNSPRNLPETTLPQQRQAPQKGNQLEDLLGLSSSDPFSSNAGFDNTTSNELTPGGEKGYLKLISSNEGVLFEDLTLQIGIKSEFHGPLGRIVFYIGNKTSAPLESVAMTLSQNPSLKIQFQQTISTIAPQAQSQQMFQVECISEFADSPIFSMTFRTNGVPKKINVYFPVVLTKFFDPIQLGSEDFFGRWKQVGGPPREVQKDIKSPGPIDFALIRTVLTGMKFSVLEGIDPNPSNFVSAGIFLSTSAKVGGLLRIQTNPADQAIRVTIRTTNPSVSEIIVNLLVKKLTQN